ncbi:angiomotin-like protein 1 isoform X2 [Xyrauchen texanus]|uniref:angiomotin-like protein 1 isoform X2 n=1 Tax=Xyrauchen texanus TaxID=154827 RepID=UPI002241BBB4|nr:angiomotin-like protein 1 isoform X2 [Xyrauchen texanus]
MDPGENWIPEDVPQRLEQNRVHQLSLDMQQSNIIHFLGAYPCYHLPTHSSADMRVSEDSTSGTMLQRLMQEHLRYETSGTRGGVGNDSSQMQSNPTSTDNLLLQEARPLQSQSRQEPQGQEHQVDSSSMENTGGVGQVASRIVQTTLTLPRFDTLELPSYEEAKIQSHLYREQQSPMNTPSQNPGYTHQSLPKNLQQIQNQVLHMEGHLNLVHQSQQQHNQVQQTQRFSIVSDSPTGSFSYPLSLSNVHSLSSPPSLSSSSTSLSMVPVKARVEGQAWVQQGSTGVMTLRDEGLAELKQGHVRSLSERLMQLSLECNGAKQIGGPPSSPCTGDTAPCGAESPANSTSPTSKTSTTILPPLPPPLPSPQWSLEQRGPPPEYPFKFKLQPMLPATLNSNPGSLEYVPLYSDTLTAAMIETVPHSNVARQSPISLSSSSLHQQQNCPMFSESCILPSQASQQPYQAMSLSESLRFPATQTGSVMSPREAPLGQPFPGEAFAMVSHAQQMMEILKDENQSLRQELHQLNEKACKLLRLEVEVEHLSDAYESLVKSSSKRESLEKTMKNKLEGEIRRLHDFNRDLRDRLETANRQLANQELNGQEDGHLYLSQRRESLKDLEKLEMEAASLRSANEDQRRHIEILEQALNNARSKAFRLEEELSKKQMYVERVERLQQALAHLQVACEKREQLERRLRNHLERELEAQRTQQRARVGVPLAVCESSAPAMLDLLREREERILGLEADMTRWEQKYLEETAMRHFAMEAAATAAAQRDTTIIQHSRSGSFSDGLLWQHEDEKRIHSSRRCQEMEQRMKDLHAQLLEKDAMIKVLQHRSRREPALLRPARSVPSISITTGLHVRQTSQTDQRDQHSWKGSTSVLSGKDTVEHILPSLPSLSLSVSSPLSPSFSSLPSSFPPFLASAGSSTSLITSSSCLLRSTPPSSSSMLPLPSSASLLPPVSFSLPSIPLLSLHSKSASRDSSSQTETYRAASTTRHWKTESPSTKRKALDGRAHLSGGQKLPLPDPDQMEILI